MTRLDIHKRLHQVRQTLEDACSIVTFTIMTMDGAREHLLLELEEAEENLHVLAVQVREFGIEP